MNPEKQQENLLNKTLTTEDEGTIRVVENDGYISVYTDRAKQFMKKCIEIGLDKRLHCLIVMKCAFAATSLTLDSMPQGGEFQFMHPEKDTYSQILGVVGKMTQAATQGFSIGK